MPNKKILITGATGFVGQALTTELLNYDYDLVCSVHRSPIDFCPKVKQVDVGSLVASTDWSNALLRVNTVIHLAARVHVMDDKAIDPLKEFRKINTAGTLNLARQASETGVKRFIFLSSIKVNGEMTIDGKTFKPKDSALPIDPYAVSKYEAEQGLLALSKETGMEIVIIRPPLIYGPGVKANFALMMKWVSFGIPLPLGSVNNKRSLVALENLVSFIICCVDNPKAVNQVFLISDNEDVSTTQILQKLAKVVGKKSLLFAIPVSWMTCVAQLIGKGDVTNRLFGSLLIDSSKARNLLGWKPMITMDEQLKKMAEKNKNEKTV